MSLEPASVQSALLSDVGRSRRENQDACGEFQGSGGARLLVVADGMGGHRGGATASQLALAALREAVTSGAVPDGALLERAITEANTRVHRAAEADVELHGMGTTCVALLLAAGSSAWVAHVGDSRAYRWRAGTLDRLTQDHSLVAQLVSRGEITPEEAEVHPRRNEILRSVGMGPHVDVDVQPVDAQPGDRFLICSDGLSSVLSDPEIGAVLAAESPERAVRLLVDAANERGGPDNVTVAIAALSGSGAAATSVGPSAPVETEGDDLRRFELELSAAQAHQRFRRIAVIASAVAILLSICLVLLVASAVRNDAATAPISSQSSSR